MKTAEEALDWFIVKDATPETAQAKMEQRVKEISDFSGPIVADLRKEEAKINDLCLATAMQIASEDTRLLSLIETYSTFLPGLLIHAMKDSFTQGFMIGVLMYREDLDEGKLGL